MIRQCVDTLMMMMMMMMMMMICFCRIVDRRKALSFIFSQDHCQRYSLSQISDTPKAVFEPAHNLSSDFIEWSCAIVITNAPRQHFCIGFIYFTLKGKRLTDFKNLFSPRDFDKNGNTIQQIKYKHKWTTCVG